MVVDAVNSWAPARHRSVPELQRNVTRAACHHKAKRSKQFDSNVVLPSLERMDDATAKKAKLAICKDRYRRRCTIQRLQDVVKAKVKERAEAGTGEDASSPLWVGRSNTFPHLHRKNWLIPRRHCNAQLPSLLCIMRRAPEMRSSDLGQALECSIRSTEVIEHDRARYQLRRAFTPKPGRRLRTSACFRR